MATGPWEKFKQQEGPWSKFAEQEEAPALVAAPAPSTARTGLESVTDIGASLVSGLGGVLELPGQLTQLVPGLYGVGKAITEPATSLREFGEGLKSAGLKAREALRSKALSEAEKEGVLAEFTTAIGQTIKDPALLTSFVAEQLPQLLGPAGAAKVAKGLTLAKAGATEATQLAAQKAAAQAAEKAAVRTGMAMQGVDISSDTLEAGIQAIKSQNPQMTDEQAAEEVINRARLAGLGGAAFSKLGMMLPGGKAIERRMAGLPGAGRVTGALGEAGSEMVEEGGGAFARNVALSDLEPERGLLTGVGTAAGLGAIGGGTLGAAFSGSAPAPADRTADEREAMRIQQELLTRQTEIAELERQAEEARKDRVPVEKLKELKIKESDDPNSMYQQILSKDLRDPEQRQEAVALLTQAKEEVTRPKAPALTLPENYDDTIQNIRLAYGDVSQPVEGATGAGVPVAGVPGAGTATEGVGVVETAGVVPAEQDVGEPAGREGQQPPAVKPEKKSLRGFYSALEEKVGAMGPKQAPAAQWKTMIQALPQKGVKPEEIEYSGVTDWLETQQGRVTKEQVQNYLKEGGVQVEETVLGGAEPQVISTEDALNRLREGQPVGWRRGDQVVTMHDPDSIVADGSFYREQVDAGNAEWIDTRTDVGGEVTNAKYGSYTIPGGENYREVLLRLPIDKEAYAKSLIDPAVWDRMSQDQREQFMEAPVKGGKGVYKSAHWDQPNVLAHIRVNDRVDPDGKKVLFVEEIQSDWGQEGKKKGFIQPMTPAKEARIKELEAEVKKISDSWGSLSALIRASKDDPQAQAARAKQTELRAEIAKIQESAGIAPTGGVKGGLAVPAAPFVTKTEGWLNLALKRIIDMAVEGGYDRVAFVNGQQSADRYDLSKQVDSVEVSARFNRDGAVEAYDVKATPLGGGRPVFDNSYTADQLPDVLGKELAEKIVAEISPAQPYKRFSGLDLKVGGEGMKTFYDQIVPTALKKLLPKVGGGQISAVPISEFGGKFTVDPGPGGDLRNFNTRQEAESFAQSIGGAPVIDNTGKLQPGFDITPAMREVVSTKGQPLFSLKTAAPEGAKPAPVEEPATPTEVQPSIESVIAQKKELQAQQIVLFEQALKKVASKYGLKDVAVKVIEDMRDANGAYSGGLIKMALDAQNPVRDIRHEAIHAMKELGFFSDQQWSTLVKRAKSEWIDTFLKQTLPNMESRYDAYLKLFKSQGMSEEQIEEAMVEEAIADAFSYFDANKAPAGLMQSILTRMRKFFKMLRDGMKGAGIESAEDIFGKIEQGALEPTREVVQPAPTEKLSIRAPQTEAFKRWFGDSKVVDAEGNPLVVYHGTTADISEFKPNKATEKDAGWYGSGIYTTADPNTASAYSRYEDMRTGSTTQGSNVMPLYVSLQNPYYWPPVRAAATTAEESASIRKELEDAGYDGVIVSNSYADPEYASHYEVIAFRPEQIKSATGNIGTYSPTEPDIRKSLRTQLPPQIVQRIADTTRPRDEKTHVQRITQALGPKSWSYFRQRALNRYNQLSVYDKRRAKLMGGAAFLADQSAESAALLSDLGAGLTASALGVHDRVGGIPVFKNGITIISNMNGTVKGPVEIFAPIAKLGDPYAFQAYQFWAMVKRGKKYFAQNNQGQYVEKLLEPSDIQRAAVIEAELRSKGVDVNAIQKEWIKYNDGLVKFMVDTGVLSKERAAIYTEHADYFPFYRQLDEDSQEGPRVFQGISGVKAPKAAKGSEAQVGDFFEVIVRNTQSAIQAGIKNVAAERAKKVALEIGMAKATHRTSGPDVFSVLENGVPKFYESADPLFIDAIKSLNLPDLPFIGLLSGPANLLRNLVTKDPGFMLANMMRDSMSAYVTSGVKMTPVAATIKNFGSALASKDPAFERLLNAGILGGYEFSQNVEASGRQFAKELRKASGKQTLQEQIMRPATWLWEALEKGTTASDAATRMEVYKKTLQETGNEAEAIYRAMEVMNFNRKGSSPVVRIATAAIPFLNARMQGLDVLYRAAFGEMAIKDAKALQRAFFVRGMTIAALSTMYWALTHDDDEYKRQEQETRDNYWLFPSLGIKIPIPFEVGVLFKVIPERIAALTFGTDTAKDFTESMTRNLMNTLAVNPIPQAALPTVEYVTNFSFFTFRPIVGQGLEGVAKPYQIGPGTSRAAQFLGHISKDLPETLQISPMKADALINGYTGSIGTYMSDLIDAIWDMHADSPKASKRFEQMPIIRRFLMDPDARGNVTAYYDLKNAVDRATRTANLMERSNDFEQYGEYMQANMGMFAVKDYILDLEKTMKEYREMKNMVRASNMDANTKRDMVLSITQMENQITENIQSLAKMARE